MTRAATQADIDHSLEMYGTCLNFEPECDDLNMQGKIYKLDFDTVKEIYYVLKNPSLRATYDKTETFIRKKTLSRAPTEG